MRIQIESCQPAFKDGMPDGFQSQHGFIPAYNIEGYCLDDVPQHRVKAGDRLNLKGNFKKPPVQGTTDLFQFKLKKDGSGRPISFPDGKNLDGSTLWRQVVERIPQNQRQNGPVNAPQSPQSGGNAMQASKPTPTMSQAVAVLSECIEAVKAIGGSDAHATTLFLARLRGDIRRDPTQAEVDAEAAKKAAAAEEARKAAEAAAAEAAKQAALAAIPGYAAGESAATDEIPF